MTPTCFTTISMPSPSHRCLETYRLHVRTSLGIYNSNCPTFLIASHFYSSSLPRACYSWFIPYYKPSSWPHAKFELGVDFGPWHVSTCLKSMCSPRRLNRAFACQPDGPKEAKFTCRKLPSLTEKLWLWPLTISILPVSPSMRFKSVNPDLKDKPVPFRSILLY